MQDDRHDRTRHRAYLLWEKEGRPHGRDQEFWERAASMEREADRPAMVTPLQKRSKAEAEQDKTVADTFPASDPASATPAKGPGKAKAKAAGAMAPKASASPEMVKPSRAAAPVQAPAGPAIVKPSVGRATVKGPVTAAKAPQPDRPVLRKAPPVKADQPTPGAAPPVRMDAAKSPRARPASKA